MVEPIETMTRRRDFVAASRAHKAVTDSLIVQNRPRKDGSDLIRIGFTASKKVGNAVARNRAKRRMRAIAREILPSSALLGSDYVMIARKDRTTDVSYPSLCRDFTHALERVHSSRKR